MTFSKIWAEVGPHSLLGETRSRVLYNLLRMAPDGGMIEIGTYKGQTAKLMLLAAPQRYLYVFDTFEGIKNSDSTIDKHIDGEFSCSQSEVEKVLLETGNDDFILEPGLFPDTFNSDPCYRELEYSFVHSDLDTYFGAKSTLEALWPHMKKGGVILFDDWKFDPCPGIEKALTEWSVTTGIEIMIPPSGGQAFIVKP